jgi:hypothetical protein
MIIAKILSSQPLLTQPSSDKQPHTLKATSILFLWVERDYSPLIFTKLFASYLGCEWKVKTCARLYIFPITQLNLFQCDDS